MKIVMGFMASKNLFVANEIGLFQALSSGPATLQELADKTGVPFRNLRIVAAAMVSVGLLGREGDQYRNSKTSAAFSVGKEGPDLRPLLRFHDQITYPEWQRFEEAVRTDQGQPRFGEFTQEQQQIFSAGVEAFAAAGAAALVMYYDFAPIIAFSMSRAEQDGSYLIAVLRRYEALQRTLFELPGACAVARERLPREPERGRIELVEGDLFKDPLPNGHDALIMANTVHVLSAAHNVELMRKMRARVEPGARFLLVDPWTDPTHSHPPAAEFMSGAFFLTSGEGQSYSAQEADEWLGQTGWRKVERKPLAGPPSLIVAEAV